MSQERGPLLILGAGASRPYGFPTSNQLRSIILGNDAGTKALQDLGVSWPKLFSFLAGKKTLVSDQALAGAVVRRARDREIPVGLPIAQLLLDTVFDQYGIPPATVQAFREEFFKSQRVSIDAFAARWPEYERVSKLAITTVLLFCERTERLDGDWYQHLLEAILRDEQAFKSSGLDVITFNYDRSLEFYVHRALMSHCRNTPQELAKFKERIRITHVYGTTGDLWPRPHYSAIGYGDVSKIGEAAGELGLVRGGDKIELPAIAREAIQEARQIVFLGFGFWRENLDVLNIQPNGAKLSASAMGLPKTIRDDLRNQYPGIELGSDKLNITGFLGENAVFAFPKHTPRPAKDFRHVDDGAPLSS